MNHEPTDGAWMCSEHGMGDPKPSRTLWPVMACVVGPLLVALALHLVLRA